MRLPAILVCILIVLATSGVCAMTKKNTETTSGIPFAERVDRFWQWFGKNTSIMDKLLQDEKDGMIRLNDLMYEGTRIIGNDVCYNSGRNRELSFSVEDQTEYFHLYPWLVASMPDSLRAKWKVYPCKQPDPAIVETGIDIFGKEINIQTIMVSVDYDKDSNTFAIGYYNPTLAKLGDEESRHAFTVILELLIGEGAVYNYVNEIRQSDDTSGMIPIGRLADTMKLLVENNGQTYATEPLLPLYFYQGKPDPDSKEVRSDIIVGSSRYLALQEEYLNGIHEIHDSLAEKGVTAMMLILTQPEDISTDDFIELRYRFEDYLTTLFDSSAIKGMLVGGAYGASGLGYIDLLLFDADQFLEYISNDGSIGAMLSPANDGVKPIQLMFKTFAPHSDVYTLR